MTTKGIITTFKSVELDGIESVTVVTKSGREYEAYTKDLCQCLVDDMLMFWQGNKRPEKWICISLDCIESINFVEKQ